MHVYVTPAANILLNFLSASFGRIRLFHMRRDQCSGEIAWSPEGGLEPASNHVLWMRTEKFELYVDQDDPSGLQGQQLVIEAAFGGNPARQLFTESKLVSLIRPADEADAPSHESSRANPSRLH
jgi:hypothetical protein